MTARFGKATHWLSAKSKRNVHSLGSFLTQYRFQRSTHCMFFVVWMLLSNLPALAVLGGDVSSLRDDQVHMNASLRSTPMPAYTIHELRTPAGMVVREFASTTGRIFAVLWKGASPPDLRQLLGAHFEDFQQAAGAQKGRGPRGVLFIQQNGLIVQIGGHMRSYAGRAYLLDQVPPGVHADDLR